MLLSVGIWKQTDRQQQHNDAITGPRSTTSENPRAQCLFFMSAANCGFIFTSLEAQQCSGSTLSSEDLITRETTKESDGSMPPISYLLLKRNRIPPRAKRT